MLTLYQTVSDVDRRYKVIFKAVRDKYVRLIRDTKRKYYANKIYTSDNKSKTMWQVIKELTKHRAENNQYKKGNIKQVASDFNHFFANISHTLLTPQSVNNAHFYNNLIRSNERSLFLTPVTSEEIVSIIRNIKNKRSTGIDDIPISVLKSYAYLIAEPLSYLIQLFMIVVCFRIS